MKKKDILFLILILAVFLLFRIPYLHLPLERDEGAYAYAGRSWISGKALPYIDFYEMKPPLLHLIYGVATGLGGPNIMSIRMVGLVYSLITVLVFTLMVNDWWSRKIALVAGIEMAILLNSVLIGSVNLNAESLILLPMLLAVWQISKSSQDKKQRGLGIGICLGLAFLYKQVVVFPAVIFAVYYLLIMRNWKSIWMIVAGGLLPILFFGIYFMGRGALPDLINNIVVLASKSTGDGFNPRYLCSGGMWDIKCILPWLIYVHPGIAVLFTVGIVGYAVNINRGKDWLAGFLWTVGMWVVVKGAGYKAWNHYYILLIPGLIIGTVLLWKKFIALSGRWGHLIMMFLLIPLFGLNLYVYFEGLNSKQPERFALEMEYGVRDGDLYADAPDVADWLVKNTDRNDVLVWNDEAEIYYYAGIINKYKWLYYYPLTLSGMDLYKKELKMTINRDPPTWIVLNDNNAWGERTLINEFVNLNDYRQVWTLGGYEIIKKL